MEKKLNLISVLNGVQKNEPVEMFFSLFKLCHWNIFHFLLTFLVDCIKNIYLFKFFFVCFHQLQTLTLKFPSALSICFV